MQSTQSIRYADLVEAWLKDWCKAHDNIDNHLCYQGYGLGYENWELSSRGVNSFALVQKEKSERFGSHIEVWIEVFLPGEVKIDDTNAKKWIRKAIAKVPKTCSISNPNFFDWLDDILTKIIHVKKPLHIKVLESLRLS